MVCDITVFDGLAVFSSNPPQVNSSEGMVCKIHWPYDTYGECYELVYVTDLPVVDDESGFHLIDEFRVLITASGPLLRTFMAISQALPLEPNYFYPDLVSLGSLPRRMRWRFRLSDVASDSQMGTTTSTVLEHNYTRAYVPDEYMNYDWFYYLTPEQESEGWHTPEDFSPSEIEEFARFGAGEGEASGGSFSYHVAWAIDLLGNGNVRFGLSSYGNTLASLEMAMTSDWYIVETIHEEGSYKASIWVDGEAIPDEWMLEGSDAGIPASSPFTMVFGFADLWRSNAWQVFWDWILVWDKVSGGEWGLGWVSEHPAIDDDWVTLRLSHPFTQGTARVDINGLRQMPDSYIEYPSSGAIVLDTELNPGDIVAVFYHIEDS